MIIVFLKYASTRKAPEPKKTKEEEKPVVKEVTTQPPVVHDGHDGNLQSVDPNAGAHLGESLG
jgi:hypothetical protein